MIKGEGLKKFVELLESLVMKNNTISTERPKTLSEEAMSRIKVSLNSGGRVEIPKGLTRGQKRQFIISNR